FHPHLLSSFPTRRSSDLIFHRFYWFNTKSINIIHILSIIYSFTSKATNPIPIPIAVYEFKSYLSIRALDATEPAVPETIRLVWRSEEHTSELQSRFDLVC